MRSRAALPTCLLALLWISADAAKKKRVPMVVRMLDGHACNLGGNALTWSNVWFTPRGTARLVNADFGLSRTAKTLTRLEFRLSKCADAIVSINTCEYMETFNYAVGPCTIMKMPNMPWTQFFGAMKPPFFCPIKAGNFSFRNAGLDPKTLDQFQYALPLDNIIWIVTLRMFDHDAREFICFNYTIEFMRSRA